jgi:hypothetical protein
MAGLRAGRRFFIKTRLSVTMLVSKREVRCPKLDRNKIEHPVAIDEHRPAAQALTLLGEYELRQRQTLFQFRNTDQAKHWITLPIGRNTYFLSNGPCPGDAHEP